MHSWIYLSQIQLRYNSYWSQSQGRICRTKWVAGKYFDMSPADYAMKAQTDSVMATSLLKASLAMYLGV